LSIENSNTKVAKTALVLSAGGLFGAYQAGAWKHLGTVLQPDLVIGASIGALNGWLIACGRGSSLEQTWMDASMASIIRRNPRPNLKDGYFDPRPLDLEIRKVSGEARPEIPYWLVVVEVPTFRTRLIPAAEVTPAHMLATCSIYLFFPTVKIDGRRFTDGGMMGHLPLWAAAQLGATRIVAIDCLPRLSLWWVQAAISTLHMLGPKRRLPDDVRILRPSELLGDARSAMSYDAARIRRWIDLGELDARREFPGAL
jgi:predicted acylesterase/phospholipase RssA